mmetsp:Transcript_2076/g.5789  ORF Transcript_2076/g.5789 Transcript_2076/m.5789 type:complete len:85 (-) Transcript_2076:25-279(-)
MCSSKRRRSRPHGGACVGGYPDFVFEKVRTTPFDWPALSALNTPNADASAGTGGALKPHNLRDNPSARRGARATTRSVGAAVAL